MNISRLLYILVYHTSDVFLYAHTEINKRNRSKSVVYSPTTDVQRLDKSEVEVAEMTIKDESSSKWSPDKHTEYTPYTRYVI